MLFTVRLENLCREKSVGRQDENGTETLGVV